MVVMILNIRNEFKVNLSTKSPEIKRDNFLIFFTNDAFQSCPVLVVIIAFILHAKVTEICLNNIYHLYYFLEIFHRI